MTEIRRVAVFGGRGKTGRAVIDALTRRGVEGVPIGRAEWEDLDSLVRSLTGADAAYLVAPNLHPDEPSYVAEALTALARAGIDRVAYHSVASPYAPSLPHHLGKAAAEDLVRRSGLSWTVLQPGVYLQNFDLSRPLEVPYDVGATFGFLDLTDLGGAAAVVLTEPGHVGATYELASVRASVEEIAGRSGQRAQKVPASASPGLDDRAQEWLSAMFDYYDRHGLPVGTKPMAMLLGRITTV